MNEPWDAPDLWDPLADGDEVPCEECDEVVATEDLHGMNLCGYCFKETLADLRADHERDCAKDEGMGL